MEDHQTGLFERMESLTERVSGRPVCPADFSSAPLWFWPTSSVGLSGDSALSITSVPVVTGNRAECIYNVYALCTYYDILRDALHFCRGGEYIVPIL